MILWWGYHGFIDVLESVTFRNVSGNTPRRHLSFFCQIFVTAGEVCCLDLRWSPWDCRAWRRPCNGLQVHSHCFQKPLRVIDCTASICWIFRILQTEHCGLVSLSASGAGQVSGSGMCYRSTAFQGNFDEAAQKVLHILLYSPNLPSKTCRIWNRTDVNTP